MENKIIKEFRKLINSASEPTRTRPFVQYECFHCHNIVEENKKSFCITKPCRECNKRLRGKQNFIQKVQEKYPDEQFTVDMSSYFDYTTPVNVTCNKHNYTYTIRPVHFVANSYANQPHKGGCPKCAEETNKTKNKKHISYYLQLLSDKFPDVQVVSHGTAECNTEKIQLSCCIHGTFEKSLASIVSTSPDVSNLCPTCSKEMHAWRTRMARTDVSGIAYFVKFKNENIYKCGVTYRSVKDRLRGHITNIEELWTLQFDTLSDAYFFEYQFFRKYKHLKCTHPNTALGGYTEFFSQPILKPTKRFIEEILCRKESNSGKLPPSDDEDNPERSLETGTCND